ncbi:catechol 2,3-dioxygenase [Candidatus Poribacteria bacterium]|nr:catechol 2,3-dioxygenase [Candidatus Poribacteria bacterium]
MSEFNEPLFEIAQLAHVEIYTPKPDETIWFFTELLGMEKTEALGQSVYLRAYEDFYHHSLKITEAEKPGLGHVGWRTTSPNALHRRVSAIEATGLGIGWSDGDVGHGPAYQFTLPDGHRMEVLWEVDYYQPPEAKRTKLKNRPQKRPIRGVPVRRIDHINLLAQEVEPNKAFLIEHLGFRLREHIILDNGTEAGCWLSVSPLVHEVAILRDPTESHGRLHHLCYWYGYPHHLCDIADILTEYDVPIEAGPGKHGIAQAAFLYVFEPGGNRIELFGDAGYLIFDPDWKPITWHEDELDKGIIWFGPSLPAEFLTYGTPPVEEK